MGPRGSAWVSASVRGGVPAWVRVGPRQCPRRCRKRSPRGSAWVCVSARWLWDLGLRKSAWVHVGSRVNGQSVQANAGWGSAWVRVRAGVGGKALCSFSRWVAGHLPLDKSWAR